MNQKTNIAKVLKITGEEHAIRPGQPFVELIQEGEVIQVCKTNEDLRSAITHPCPEVIRYIPIEHYHYSRETRQKEVTTIYVAPEYAKYFRIRKDTQESLIEHGEGKIRLKMKKMKFWDRLVFLLKREVNF